MGMPASKMMNPKMGKVSTEERPGKFLDKSRKVGSGRGKIGGGRVKRSSGGGGR